MGNSEVGANKEFIKGTNQNRSQGSKGRESGHVHITLHNVNDRPKIGRTGKH